MIDLVDNDGVSIPSSVQNGQICLLAAAALAETDLVAAQDVDDPLLPTVF